MTSASTKLSSRARTTPLVVRPAMLRRRPCTSRAEWGHADSSFLAAYPQLTTRIGPLEAQPIMSRLYHGEIATNILQGTGIRATEHRLFKPMLIECSPVLAHFSSHDRIPTRCTSHVAASKMLTQPLHNDIIRLSTPAPRPQLWHRRQLAPV